MPLASLHWKLIPYEESSRSSSSSISSISSLSLSLFCFVSLCAQPQRFDLHVRYANYSLACLCVHVSSVCRHFGEHPPDMLGGLFEILLLLLDTFTIFSLISICMYCTYCLIFKLKVTFGERVDGGGRTMALHSIRFRTPSPGKFGTQGAVHQAAARQHSTSERSQGR